MSYYSYAPYYFVYPYLFSTPYYDVRAAYPMNAYYSYLPYYNYGNYAVIPYPYIENRVFQVGSRANSSALIVWHNSNTGETQIWFMNGHRLVSRGTVVDENGQSIFIGPPFSIVGIGDMDGNGKADIVWYNSNTGETQIWFMNGHRLVSRGTVVDENGQSIFIGPPFSIVGIGDMDGNGKADIVWHNSNTGETQIWFMNGHRLVSRGTVVDENGQSIFIGPPFSIVGIGDMDGNGKADIVWYNSNTGETQIWFMNGHRLVSRGTVVDESGQPIFIGPPFSIVGIGDMDGNGKADIVWYNSNTGETQIWFMNGHRLVSRGTVVDENGQPIFIGPPFSIVGVSSEVSIIGIEQKIRTFHRRTGGNFGPLGYPVSRVERRPDGKYVQNFQLGLVTLDNPFATPESFTKYGSTVTISAVKCFGTEDPSGEDEPYVIVSLISVNPNFVGTDSLVQTTRTEILDNVKAGDVIFENRTIGSVNGFPGSGIKIHVAIFDHENGDADQLRKKINAVLEDAARKGSGALAAAAAADSPKLAGAVGDITNFEVGGVKPFHILTFGVAGLITDILADDLIGEHEFFIPAAKLVEWADSARFNASLKTSSDLPSRIRFNVPEKPEDEFLFSGGGGSYKIYFKIQGYKIEHVVEANIPG